MANYEYSFQALKSRKIKLIFPALRLFYLQKGHKK